MKKAYYKDLGLIKYKDAWDYQEEIVAKRVKNKFDNSNTDEADLILFCEHPNVYTLGKSGDDTNLLLDYIQMQAKNVEFFKTNRGGDITYHGPGQIVGYPIIDLDRLKIGIKQYIHLLEKAVIITLDELGIKSERLEGATGVWLDTDTKQKQRKICAIGVKVSRSVTMHGFAFNVNTDLSYFNHINPCGFVDKGVTSLEKELGTKQDYEAIKTHLLKNLCKVFEFELIDN